jgi:hypothetical protein
VEHPYVFLDGIVMKRTWAGEVRNVSLLVAIGVNDEGFREILGIFPVTPEVDAHARPRERGTRLVLVEIAQFEGRPEDAFEHLVRLVEIEPQDPIVLLSFVEIALEQALNRRN